ncbi:MAG: MMPL family transporter [Pseudomonadota bacterium]
MITARTLSHLLISWRWSLFVASCLCLFPGANGLRDITFSTDSRAFFGEDNPDYRALRKLEDTYSYPTKMLIVIAADGDTAFTPDILTALRDATEKAWALPYVLRVDSVANFNRSYAEGDEVFVEPLIAQDVPITSDMAKQIARLAMDIPELKGRALAEDGRTVSIGISLAPSDTSRTAYRAIQAEFDAFRDRLQERLPDTRVLMTGGIMGSLAFADASARDLRVVLPYATAAVLALLALGLGSLSGVVASAAVLATSAIMTLGISAMAGIELAPGNSSGVLAVVVLMAATCMHIAMIFLQGIDRGLDRREAVAFTYQKNLMPVGLTNLTTTFGFICLNFADAPPLQDLGNMVAIGILSGWVFSMTLMPAILLLLPAPRRPRRQWLPAALSAAVAASVARRRLIIPAFLALTAICLMSLPFLRFNDDFVRYFDEAEPFRAEAEVIEDRLGGLRSLQFSFESQETGGIFAPDFLRQMEAFETWLMAQEPVGSVSSLLQPIRRLNKNLNGGDPAFERVAATAEANAQLLLFYELNLPVGQDVNSLISVDRTRTVLSVSLDLETSTELRAFAETAEAWLRSDTSEIAVRSTGSSLTFARVSQTNGAMMLIGTVVVLLIVSASLLFTLRDRRLGAISIVPNLLPAILAFGIWGLFLRDLNLGSTVVTVMTFGIVVDDTIHLLVAYQRARRAGGEAEESAVEAIRTVGPAITFTSITIIVGFLFVASSGFAINQHLGLLTAIVIGAAYLADLIFLPALLVQLESKRNDT